MIQAHRTGTSMARVLVQYIDDPKRVAAAVRQEFNTVPSLWKIARMREEFLRPAPPPISFKVQKDAYSAAMERSNRAFLTALASASDAERAA